MRICIIFFESKRFSDCRTGSINIAIVELKPSNKEWHFWVQWILTFSLTIGNGGILISTSHRKWCLNEITVDRTEGNPIGITSRIKIYSFSCARNTLGDSILENGKVLFWCAFCTCCNGLSLGEVNSGESRVVNICRGELGCFSQRRLNVIETCSSLIGELDCFFEV